MAIGAYAVERDYSHYVSYLSKTVFAVVGTASRGPVGVATVCTSAQDLVNKFGNLSPTRYGLYAAQYFLSQASKMYFVRAASDDIAAATVKLKGRKAATGEQTEGTLVDDALTFAMLEEGTFSNGYKIKVTKNTGTEVTYDLLLKTASGTALESIKGVKLADLVVGYTTSNLIITAKNTQAVTLEEGEEEILGGNDGDANIVAGDYIEAAQALRAESIDMNLFAVPGQSDRAIVTAMLSLAETRGDCLYLVDAPIPDLTKTKAQRIQDVIDWHNATNTYATGDNAKFNSSYGALYYDWVLIYDSFNKVKVQVPPSVAVAATIAYSDRVSELWYAPAGLNRGVVKGVLSSITKLDKSESEYLYGEGNNINPLYDDPQVGLVLWGQKTLSRSATALDRINVRRMLNYLKKVVVSACNYLTFEPNDRITWNSFEMKVKPVLDSLKNRRGIYEYRIVKGETIITDEDIDNYKMPCMIMFKPTKAAEEIPIYFVLTSTGADFNEVLEANGVVTDN